MLLLEFYIFILALIGIIVIALIHICLWLISFFGISFELSTTLPDYKIWINFFNLYIIGAAVWLVNSYVKRWKSGDLLFRMSRTKDNKEMFWFGLWGIAFAAFHVRTVWYLVVENENFSYTNLRSEVFVLLFGGIFSIACFIRSLNKLELR